MATPSSSPAEHSPTAVDVLAALKPVAVNLDLVVGDLWRSVEIWDLTQRLEMRSSTLPADVRMELQSLLAASERLEEDLHRLQAAYQCLADFVDAITTLQHLQRKSGR